jgi:metal-dependent amidase/aminoacylase/carboxypeptidase family protein
MIPLANAFYKKVVGEVDRLSQDILRVSLDIHGHPEPGLKEHHACALLTAEAAARGFAVQTPVADMDTAFVARYTSGKPGPQVAFLCEYDALPGLAMPADTMSLPRLRSVQLWLCVP